MRLIFTLLVLAATARAHHSFASEYDIDKPVRLAGTIARIDFSNPHTHIYLDVGATEWSIEAASPNALLRRGFHKQSAPPGTRVIIDAYQAKSGPGKASARDIVLPGGYIFLLGTFSEGVK